MAFLKHTPPARVQTGKFKFGTTNTKNGPWKLLISMTNAEYQKRFGNAEKLSFFLGQGADEGRVALGVDPDGELKPTFFRSAVLIRIAGVPGTPEDEFESIEPTRKMNSEGYLEIELPEWWKRWPDIKKARETVRRQGA